MSTFPSDIRLAMRNCILKVLWAKDDIVSFFRTNSCTDHDVKALGNYKDLSRAGIVDGMFNYLAGKPDEGLGQFRAILQSLTQWTHFDPYYFDDLKKLKREDAQAAITHLQQLQEIRDAKLKEARRDRERKEAAARTSRDRLKELRGKFMALLQGQIAGSERGYALEGILQSVAKLESLETTQPFRVNGEQIDGAIKYDGEHYIIEAKWQDKAASNEPVYQFAGKVEGKMYGRGIFISIQGYSDNVIKSLVTGKAIKTIFVDGADLTMVFEEMISFSSMLDRKIKAAQTQGLIYVDVLTGKAKV